MLIMKNYMEENRITIYFFKYVEYYEVILDYFI